MTPTEQDKELHSKSYKLAQEYLSTNNLGCFVDLIQNNLTLDEALQLITADRKRVALEARLDELKQLTEFEVATIGIIHGRHLRSYRDRIAELKAQREEVK